MDKIDCRSLMIGDWLFYRGQYNAFPFRVEQITKKKVGYHAGPNETRMRYLRLCECQPIPLTSEILEKNGMHLYNRKTNNLMERQNHSDCFQEDEDFRLELSLDYDDKIRWSINGDEYSILTLDYVHQLQHAIRLVGLEKTIVL